MPSYIRTRNEFAVNSFTAGTQGSSSVSTFGDGGFIVTWASGDTTQDGSSFAIKAQLFDSAGSKVATEFLVNSLGEGNQTAPSVATLSNGNFVVSWLTNASEDGSDGIKAQLFSRAGDPIGAEFKVNLTNTGSHFTPNVSSLAGGGFVISWDDWNSFDMKAQIFDASGARVGAVLTVNTNTEAFQEYGDIVGLAGGGFVATWRTTDTTADGSDNAVKAQVFSASGAKVGTEFLVNSQKTGYQYSPSVTALSGGGFVVAWQTTDTAQDGSEGAIKAQVFSATGAKVGGEFLVNSQTVGLQQDPAVTATPDGGFVIAWTTWNSAQDGSSSAIKAQAFDSAGAKVGGELLVNTLAAGTQVSPDLATLADGRVIVTWSSESGDISNFSIRAQILGTELAPPLPNRAPVIISDGGGTSVSIARDERLEAVTTVVASDDGEPNNLRYSISGGADASLFRIDAFTGALSFVQAPEFDPGGSNSYSVSVTASDGQLTASQSIQVTVNDVNRIVIVSDGGHDWAEVRADENQTAVTTVSALDEDGLPLTYSITGGEDAALFTIDPQTGVLSFIAAPDYEEPQDRWQDNFYEVRVTATDGTLSDSQDIGVVVQDVPEDPGFGITSDGGDDLGQVVMPENRNAVTTVAASGAAGPVTYAITGGYDAHLFTIDAATGELSFVDAPDFESPPGNPWGPNHYSYYGGYQVVVGATDGSSFDEQELKVVVEDVDEAPVFDTWWGEAHLELMQSENDPFSSYASASDPDRYSWVTYGLEGADAALFQVDPYGMIAFSFAGGVDFEAPADADGDNVYEFTVVAYSGALSATQSFSIAIQNANEQPVIVSDGGGAYASVEMDEGGELATRVETTDDGPNPVNYAITGGWAAHLFAIDSLTGELFFRQAPDYENPVEGSDNIYTVEITADDGELWSSQTIEVTVRNVYEDVRFDTPSRAFSIDENVAAVGAVSARGEEGATLHYSIMAGVGDGAYFLIDGDTGQISFLAAPDFENAQDMGWDNVYNLSVRVTDGTTSAYQSVAVTVGEVDEPTEIVSYGGASNVTLSVEENGLAAGTVQAQDGDGGTVTYSIAGGADASAFTIDSATGVLSFVSAPDFESAADADRDNDYEVIVRASDGTSSDEQHFSVEVANADEVPEFVGYQGGTAQLTLVENRGHVADLLARDPDAGSEPIHYLIVGGADRDLFRIDSQTGRLSLLNPAGLNFEDPTDFDRNNVYHVEVMAGSGGLGRIQAFAVTVVNANEPVTILSPASITVTEGEGTYVTRVAGYDVDGTFPTYSIVGGADAARFTLDAETGVLRFVATPDFEAPTDLGGDNVYTVEVAATDREFTTTQTMQITVRNVAERTVITSYGGSDTVTLNLPENGTAAATVQAVDPDGGRITYSLNGEDSALFAIDAATGELRFVGSPNFEAPADADGNNSYLVTVVASDGTSTDTQAFRINIGNVDEGAGITSNGGGATAAVSVGENGLGVTKVVASDPEGAQVTYSIAGGADAARFTIDAATGALAFVAAPNFEAPADSGADNVYDVVVAASDGSSTDTQALAVTVTNVNEAPAIGSNGGGSTASVPVAENSRTVTTVAALDPDGTSPVYSISGGADAARFTIDAQTGLLQFVAAPDWETPGDSNGDNVYSVIVQAGDGSSFDQQTLSVSVLNQRDGANVTGTTGGDSISGTSTNPALRTTNAEDTVSGRDGHDTILGLGGDDILMGDAGNDVLNGGTGADRLTGGLGKDQFVYNSADESTAGARDVITDFSRSQGDKISLSGVDANSVLSGNQSFTFIGAAAFSGVAGQLRYSTSGGTTLVSGDIDGNGTADFQIELTGTLAPIASDFVL